MYRKLKYLLICLTMGYFIAGIALAAGDEGFYKGKTLRLLVAFAPGGGFDTYSRAIGRHMSKHIPGSPSVIVDNMTGAGGFIHANYMYRQAKPDGLTLGNNIGGLILQQIMGAKGADFDGKQFEFIGAPAIDNPVCVLTKASGITSMNAMVRGEAACEAGRSWRGWLGFRCREGGPSGTETPYPSRRTV